MSLDQHSPARPENYYGTLQQPQSTSGLAVAGLVLAFLAAPIGFALSLIAALTIARRPKKKGRGLAITGLIVSVLMIGGATTAVVALSNSTLADPGCSAGKNATFSGVGNLDDLNDLYSLQKTINNLRVAADEATHDNVRTAMTALADDYTQLLNATATGSIPDGLADKLTTDAATIDSLCSIGG